MRAHVFGCTLYGLPAALIVVDALREAIRG